MLFCWSGGKDSAMALHVLRQQRDVRIAALLTTVTDGYDRISMHGVRRTLLLRQVAALGLPLCEVRIPPQCVNAIYEERMRDALLAQKKIGVHCVAFGDIFLQDLREYRERNLAQVEMTAIFPIWKRGTRELAKDFCALGFRAIFATCRPAWMPVAKTESFIPSSTTARFSRGRLRSNAEKLSNGMDFIFVI